MDDNLEDEGNNEVSKLGSEDDEGKQEE